MIIRATKILSQNLHPGDLFSIEGPEYWQGDRFHKEVGGYPPLGEKVYIRTEGELPEDQNGIELFKLTIEHVSK